MAQIITHEYVNKTFDELQIGDVVVVGDNQGLATVVYKWPGHDLGLVPWSSIPPTVFIRDLFGRDEACSNVEWMRVRITRVTE